MKQRVKELIEIGDKLFSKRSRFMNLCQEVALHFYPERADFTAKLDAGDEYASHLMTGAPVLMRRDLANQLSAMLRPRDKPWFRARTHEEEINEDAGSKQYLDKISDRMRRIMYEKRAQFVRTTKQGDNDFATFGQCVIQITPNEDNNGLLYRCQHLRDTAWCESSELAINTVHRKWNLEAVQLNKLFPETASSKLQEMVKKDPHKEVKCRHIVLPADQYDYSPDAQAKKKYGTRKLPFISIYIDIDNETILEEVPFKRLGYVIPRWATVSGSQYAHSPATAIAHPDARLLQQITLTLLEAGQKTVDPPSVSVGEAVQGPLQLFAGGNTWIDSDYENPEHAIRYLPIDAKGLNFGMEREKLVLEMIKEALYLNQIDVPYPEGDMTATEYRGRVEQYIMRALPLFEPMEVEYNGGVCEETFNLLMDMNAFGSFEDMPEKLSNQDIRWSFESPLQDATERAKSAAFVRSMELLKIGAEGDPTVVHDFDVSMAFRDALLGAGSPSKWVVPEDKAAKAKQKSAQDEAARAQMADMAGAAELAERAGSAAQNIGGGMQAIQQAGLV